MKLKNTYTNFKEAVCILFPREVSSNDLYFQRQHREKILLQHCVHVMLLAEKLLFNRNYIYFPKQDSKNLKVKFYLENLKIK